MASANRRRSVMRPVVMVVVAVVLGGCGFVGCAPKEPVLGTRDVCSLFDAGKLDAAVPGGKVMTSELSRHHSMGNAGLCQFRNFEQYPAVGDFAGLSIDVWKAFDKNPAEAHEDVVNLLRNTCERPPPPAPVHGPQEGAEQWCEWAVVEVTDSIARYRYAVRRDLMVVAVEYEYRLPAEPARVDSARQVTRAVAESAFR